MQKLYENCVIAVSFKRDTCVLQVPKELEPLFEITDQLDKFWGQSFAGIRGLQPGVYFCSIMREWENDDEENATIFVGEIVAANLLSNRALQLMATANMDAARHQIRSQQ
jgi:hypothetical protein